eukprot:TRINITY_DN74484_c0_g1_i1.p1 TRINITY_DN74484_c0_g1~~TRINITY_DN74484_c0_g1_i1.p1  ORF type:complete len:774 (-),score=148.10 TRINITY_DN74484_c0_g1_i1:97-2418(-)
MVFRQKKRRKCFCADKDIKQNEVVETEEEELVGDELEEKRELKEAQREKRISEDNGHVDTRGHHDSELELRPLRMRDLAHASVFLMNCPGFTEAAVADCTSAEAAAFITPRQVDELLPATARLSADARAFLPAVLVWLVVPEVQPRLQNDLPWRVLTENLDFSTSSGEAGSRAVRLLALARFLMCPRLRNAVRACFRDDCTCEGTLRNAFAAALLVGEATEGFGLGAFLDEDGLTADDRRWLAAGLEALGGPDSTVSILTLSEKEEEELMLCLRRLLQDTVPAVRAGAARAAAALLCPPQLPSMERGPIFDVISAPKSSSSASSRNATDESNLGRAAATTLRRRAIVWDIAQLFEGFGGKDDDRSMAMVRACAASAAGRLVAGTEYADMIAERIAALLGDSDASVRAAAAEGLEKIGPVATRHAAAVLGKSFDRSTCKAAALALSNMGTDAVSALVGFARSDSPVIREVAVTSLGLLGDKSSEVVVACVAERLADDSHRVREAALLALSRQSFSNAKPHLQAAIELLLDQNPNVRKHALTALGAFPLIAAAHAAEIAEGLGDIHWSVRKAAASCLAKLPSTASNPYASKVAKLFSDEIQEVVEEAAVALGSIGGAAQAHLLVALLNDDAQGIRDAAVGSLRKLLLSPSAVVREAAAAAVGLARDKQATEPLVDDLIAATLDEDKNVREEVARAIGALGAQTPARAAAAVAELLRDVSWSVQVAAAEALGAMPWLIAQVYEPNLKVLLGSDIGRVRRTAAVVLKSRNCKIGASC